MTWREKLLRRVVPLWAGAAAIFMLPHACPGIDRDSTRLGLLARLALLFPIAWALCRLAAVRALRGAVTPPS